MSVSKLYPVAVPDKQLDNTAAALAHLQNMNNELATAHEENGQLRADLNRAEDRITMLVADRDRFQADTLTYRDLLIELATQMDVIGKLTVSAQGISQRVRELQAQRDLDQASTQQTGESFDGAA